MMLPTKTNKMSWTDDLKNKTGSMVVARYAHTSGAVVELCRGRWQGSYKGLTGDLYKQKETAQAEALELAAQGESLFEWTRKESKWCTIAPVHLYKKEFRDFSRGRDEIADIRAVEVGLGVEYVVETRTTLVYETRLPGGEDDYRVVSRDEFFVESPRFASYEECKAWASENLPGFECREAVFPQGTGPRKIFV